jgi:hypothetical protein
LRQAAALDVGCRGALFSRRSGALREALFSAPLLNAVAEVDDAAGESVLIDELKIGARLGRQCGVAPTKYDWPDKQVQLVDQPSD